VIANSDTDETAAEARQRWVQAKINSEMVKETMHRNWPNFKPQQHARTAGGKSRETRVSLDQEQSRKTISII
jgi:hypothetical protein